LERLNLHGKESFDGFIINNSYDHGCTDSSSRIAMDSSRIAMNSSRIAMDSS
jgi:hypothetical protein